MTKLPLNSLQNIEKTEIKALLKENKAISGFSYFVRDYVGDVLKNEGKFGKEDFEVMKVKAGDLGEYANQLGFIKNDFSYELINSLNKIYSKEYLELINHYLVNNYYNDDLLNNRKDIDFLVNINEKNIIYFINLYKIKSKSDFIDICENENIKNLFECENDTLLFIKDKLKINNINEFENICNNLFISDILIKSKIKNLKYIFTLYDIKNSNEFENICQNKNIIEFIEHGKESNWEYIIGYFNIKTTDEFEIFCNNKNIRYLLKYSKTQNLKYIFDLYKIDDLENFIQICSNVKIIEFLISSEEKNLYNASFVYDIKNSNDFEKISHNENLKNILKYVKTDIFEYLTNSLDRNIVKSIIENYSPETLNKLNIERIKNHKLGTNFGFFTENIFINSKEIEKIDFPINKNNFFDFMKNDEVLIEFEKDLLTKSDLKNIWTKSWFSEKKERINYLKQENLKNFAKFGTINYLHYLDDLEGINKINLNNSALSKIIGNEISIKNFTSLHSENSDLIDIIDDENLEIIMKKIGKVDIKKLKLINSYIKEIGISQKYFYQDLVLNTINLDKINIKIIINLLKNRIYPTYNIIIFLEKGGNIKELSNIKKGYKKNGDFNSKDKLQIDLEYIDFRYMIDNSTKSDNQEEKGYEKYIEMINEVTSEKSKEFIEKMQIIVSETAEIIYKKEELYYLQAAKESYIAKSFIDKILSENKKINVFSNFSYGKVISGAFREKIKENKKINYNNVRIGSTECHEKQFYLKLDLFSKEDIKNLFYGDTIILDGTINSSFPDSNIGFYSYFYVLNKALSEVLKNDNFINEYDLEFTDAIKNDKNYYKLLNYFKNIILGNNLEKNAKKFEFIYVSQNKNLYIKTRGDEKKYIYETEKNAKNINIYFSDFVERIGEQNGQAYFDDTHITDFVIVPTEKGFNYVDNDFEKRLVENFDKFEKKGDKDFEFYFYK